jgi:hypothetical protein
MASETDNLVVANLREVHAELQGIAGKLAEHDRRFDRLDKRLEDFQLLVNHALGLATMNATRMRALEARHDASEAWRRGMDDRLDRLERRLGKVEEKLGT